MRLRWLTIVLMGVGFVTACAGPEPTSTLTPTPTSAPTATPLSSPTPTPPLPAATPAPLQTPTPAPLPIPTPTLAGVDDQGHINFPYHSGDIVWATEEDSVQLRVTV